MRTYPKHPKILSEGTLRGEKIASLKGNTLGKVEDFILDVTAGRVALVLLFLTEKMAKSSFWPSGRPWNWTPSRHAFVLNVDSSQA